MLRFQLNYVCQWLTGAGIRKALQYLPPALDSAYENVLFRIQLGGPEIEKLAFKVLGWIYHANRPLTAIELLKALSIDESSPETDDDELVPLDVVVECCMGLVVQNSDLTVRFSHHSVVEYLRSHEQLIPTKLQVGRVCVAYLLHATVWDCRFLAD